MNQKFNKNNHSTFTITTNNNPNLINLITNSTSTTNNHSTTNNNSTTNNHSTNNNNSFYITQKEYN